MFLSSSSQVNMLRLFPPNCKKWVPMHSSFSIFIERELWGKELGKQVGITAFQSSERSDLAPCHLLVLFLPSVCSMEEEKGLERWYFILRMRMPQSYSFLHIGSTNKAGNVKCGGSDPSDGSVPRKERGW